MVARKERNVKNVPPSVSFLFHNNAIDYENKMVKNMKIVNNVQKYIWNNGKKHNKE